MKEKKYIRVPVSHASQSVEAFKDLMGETETILNELEIPKSRKPKPSDVEFLTVDALKKATSLVPCFNPSDIKLVSGLQFPDITVEKFYGVEVKTSQSGWSSIGSSIIESTRIPNVEYIYMVFGNLKDNPARFKCKPYDQVLTDIKVTHSPRYEIDMNASETVFDLMEISYDLFRREPDHKKIELAQIYTRKKLRERGNREMPWWIKNFNDNNSQGNIRLWNDLSLGEKKSMTIQCMILFPEVLDPRPSHTKYNGSTLWLCSYHQIVSPNIRDIFSAGGQIEFVHDKRIYKIPRVFGRVKEYLSDIEEILRNPDDEFSVQMTVYNPSLLKISPEKRFNYWLSQILRRREDLPIEGFLFGNKK